MVTIIGIKNRFLILINWIWQYITYDQSLRLIIKPNLKKETNEKDITNTIEHKSFAGL